MLSTIAARSLRTPALRSSLASFAVTSAAVRYMAKHNRPNNSNNSNAKSTDGSRTPASSPQPSTKPSVAFTPSHPGARGNAARIDLSKGQFQKSDGQLQGRFKEGGNSGFSETQPELDPARPGENTAPQAESPSATGAPRKPLPDLTRGIPSTLDFEAGNAPNPIDITESDEPQPSSGGRGKGELPASAYISSTDKKRARAANIMYVMFAVSAITGVVYLGRDWDEPEEELQHPDAPSGWGLGMMWQRASARMGDQLNYYNEPAFRKLLPDPDPLFTRPYTLVLSLEDLLIHSEWTREHGWRLAKRPGVDYFLRYLSNYYEIVIFTTQPMQMADPIIRKLDPFHIAQWPLFREATLYENGEYVKDLSYLNRDLSKVILVDTVASRAKKQPQNAIILEKWKGDPKDKDLVSLIPFLEYLCIMDTPDVRKAIASFDGHHIPTEFARREAISRAKFQAQLAEEKQKSPKRSALAGFSSALGIKNTNMLAMEPGAGEGFAQGKMLQDQARERAMKQYLELEKEIRENGEKWLKEEAANEKLAQAEGMKAMKTGFTGWFGGAPPQPPPAAA